MGARPPDEMFDFRFFILHETEKAYLVGETLDRQKGMWLPKSQCVVTDTGLSKGKVQIADFAIAEWLCIEKGLI